MNVTVLKHAFDCVFQAQGSGMVTVLEGVGGGGDSAVKRRDFGDFNIFGTKILIFLSLCVHLFKITLGLPTIHIFQCQSFSKLSHIPRYTSTGTQR